MNRIVTITISKESVLESIKNITAYIGAKTPDASGNVAYDRIAIFEEDAAIIDNLWTLACNELLPRYVRYIMSHENGDSELMITLDMPSNALENIQDTLTSSSEAFLAYCILSKWCDIAKQEDAKIYEEDIQVTADAIKSALTGRVRPSRSRN